MTRDEAMKAAAVEAAENGLDCFGSYPPVEAAWGFMCDGDYADRLEEAGEDEELVNLFDGDSTPPADFVEHYERAKTATQPTA